MNFNLKIYTLIESNIVYVHVIFFEFFWNFKIRTFQV
jgi:hypothetical protein